jgi:MOSC domain-containing protein YiiM
MSYTKAELLGSMPQTGKVEWIGIRAERRAPVEAVQEIQVDTDLGLTGDHYSKNGGRRQVSLIQAEHVEAVEKMLNTAIDPAWLRRNIVVSGVNLLAFADRQFQLGDVILEMTGHCHPCSRLEENLGPGGYNAMRGHGGITARVIRGGTLRVGDEVRLVAEIVESI